MYFLGTDKKNVYTGNFMDPVKDEFDKMTDKNDSVQVEIFSTEHKAICHKNMVNSYGGNVSVYPLSELENFLK